MISRINDHGRRDQSERAGHREIDVLKLLLQQQPVARDLRLISAALKMVSDMERIGDQACGHCGTSLNKDDEVPVIESIHPYR